ncbi:MurR/RpiR family transcriptional regulator [Mesorhizobium sp. BH1-1-4]|uniref:MurR/RpiR family transcriptional regulator n=1 Tax=Mesorhizobium sp. BH1-1-4 TaxID=2876662 RepID=UPI001CD07A27|nr:MurR/RpiR family transcriptional regulator [Mesorhizobium sp. BH1-1-4]MBZ9994290.1 MurR/RpiR family transcriptional regulator [Mesorhizobium sp. BH1-1-4]
MSQARSVLPMIRAHMPQLPLALMRIAKYVIGNPELIVHQSAAQVASFSKSGQASVIRFCRTVGFEGFQDFKLALAGELATRPIRSPAPDASRKLSDELGDNLIAAIQENRSLLNFSNVEVLATRLLKAKRVDVYGGGFSGILASLLAARLLRLGIHAFAISDPTFGAEVAHGLDGNCVAIAISETGLTRDTVTALRRAQSAGAFTAAITSRPESPLVGAADLILLAASIVSPLTGGALTPAFTHLFVIEVLVSAATIARKESAIS